jgi:outer membrane autotransporter protein
MNSCPTFDQPQGSDMKERDCIWGRVIDNRTTDRSTERANYSAGTHSVQVGGQKEIAKGWFLGASAAYDNEDFSSSTGAGSVDGSGGAVGVVLKREIGNWTISGAADFGRGSYDTLRNIAFPGFAAQASGSFNLTQAGLHSRIAYLVPQGNWYLKPYLDLHAVHLHTSGYSEQGAGPLGLNVDGTSDTMFSASPMLELGGRVEMDNGMTFRPYAAVGGTFHNKNEWGADAQFQGAAAGVMSFNTAASAPASLANVRLGMDLMVNKNLQLRAEYGGQFGSGYRSSEGILRVNYLF